MPRPLSFPFILRRAFVMTAAGNYTMTNEQLLLIKKTVGQATTVTLPPPPSSPLIYQVVMVGDAKGDAATNNITIQGAAAATIDGAASFVISTNYGTAKLVWNGTEWTLLTQKNNTGANTTIPGNLTVTGTTTLTGAATLTGGIADATNVVLGTATGTQVGTASNQKLGLWGATPVIQPAGTGELVGLNGNAATAANATNMNSNGNLGTRNFTLNDIVKALKQAGILASS